MNSQPNLKILPNQQNPPFRRLSFSSETYTGELGVSENDASPNIWNLDKPWQSQPLISTAWFLMTPKHQSQNYPGKTIWFCLKIGPPQIPLVNHHFRSSKYLFLGVHYGYTPFSDRPINGGFLKWAPQNGWIIVENPTWKTNMKNTFLVNPTCVQTPAGRGPSETAWLRTGYNMIIPNM